MNVNPQHLTTILVLIAFVVINNSAAVGDLAAPDRDKPNVVPFLRA